MLATLPRTGTHLLDKVSGSFGIYKFLLVCFVAIAGSRLWSYKGIPKQVFDYTDIAISAVLAVITVLHYHRLKQKNVLFTVNVHLFLFLPLVSALAAGVFHDQPVGLSVLALKANFFWLLYFVLHIFEIPVKRVIQLMILMGAGWVVVTVIQQFTYPAYYFYNRSEDGDQEFFRAGIYRFMADPYQYGVFLLLFFYYRFLTTKKLLYLAWVFFAVTGFYYFSTRQIAIGAFASMGMATLLIKGRQRYYALIFIGLISGALYYFRDYLFAEYIEMSATQLDSKDDIRLLAGEYFLKDFWPNKFAFLTGNGLEHGGSYYGQDMQGLSDTYGYFRSDVGIIGALNTFGIFYVINIIWLNIKGLRVRVTTDSLYLRLFFFFALLLLIISEQYAYPSAIPFFCFILYLADKSNEAVKKKKAGEETIPVPEQKVMNPTTRF